MKTHEHNHDSDPLTNLLRETIAGEPLPPADPGLREALLKRLDQPPVRPAISIAAASRRRTFFQRAGIALASTAAVALIAVLWQRPELQVIGWNEPAAVRQELGDLANNNKNDPSAASSPATAQPTDEVLLFEATAMHDRRVKDSGNLPAKSAPDGDMASSSVTSGSVTGGSVASGQADPLASLASPAVPTNASGPATRPAGASAGKSVSDPTFGDRTSANKKLTYGLNPPTSSASAAKSPEFNLPARPVVTTTPRILVQESVEGLRVEGESKPSSGNGQGLPAGLVPGQEPADRFYKETDGKELKLSLKQLEDQVTKSEVMEELTREKDHLAKQLAAKDAVVAKVREAEVRQKVDRVVALTEELNRGRRVSGREAKGEEKKLAELAEAIQEAREVESKFRFIPQPGGEQYARIVENQFLHPTTAEQALSTFSIDVDTASYANVRRFLNNGQLPPADAVRLEELVNYFKYKYPQPKGDDPFSVNLEMADCPWHPGHKLLRVGLQGKEVHRAERPASNLVFLIDTSGSMTDANKLPLLKTAFTMLVGELNENDKVTIVTYAGNAGLRLPPTRGHEKETIVAAIDGMQSGGSTHGSAGIALAYEVAAAQFIKGGTNKVILATDGDLNVGITDDSALVELITKKAETGVYLTVLGVGTGNLKDAKMEKLADNGNGIYAYLDSVREARKVLVEEMSGSLVTIAKDVKIQLEFNPAEVQSYRLLGYENRIMAHQDFRNDAKDAGEIGAGHSVTALYEVALVGSKDPAVKSEASASQPLVEPLKYQRVPTSEKPSLEATKEAKTGELLEVRLRYKKPEATKDDAAKEIRFSLKDKGGNFNSASHDFQFASAVVAFGLTLRNSEFRGGANLSAVAEIATAGVGEDPNGHRAEFLDLVRRAKMLRGE